ncbi:hypothetical protein M0811_11837 [Anaeramoeba ignava]|uniref:Uncharacterized protein n=1 Tax=Anaeramoeba ignava TaxID=1746090 RepID=A0A9Q0R6P6_ANAIG|nr:hypothetical protein M0811_11837 [Anaeramoeba ignava]
MVSFTQILFIENDHTHSEEKQFESFQLFSVFPEVLLKYLIKLFNLLANCDCISQLKSPSRSILEPQQNIQMDPKISFHYFIFKTLYLPFLEVFHFLENITISDEIMENVCEQFQKCVDSTNFAHDYKQFVMDFDKFPNGNISQSFSQSLAKYVDWSKIVVDEQLIQNFAESINGNNALIAISSFDKFDWKVYLSTKITETETQIINFFCKNISVEKEIEENTYNSIIDFANHLIFSINPIKSEKKENKIIVDMAEQKQKIREAIPINDITESIETMNSSEFKIVLVVLFSKMIGNFAKTKDPKKSEIYMNFLYNILKVAIISQQSRIKRNYRGSPQNTKDLQQFINSFLMYCDQEDLKKLVDIQEQETNLSLKIISENLVVFLFSEIVEVLSEINYTTDSILRLIDLFNISRTKIREILMKLFFQKTNKLIFIAEFMKNIIQKIHSKDFLYLLLEIFSFRILSNSTEINTIISVIQGLQFDNQACIKFGNFNLLILSFLMKEREVELTENFNVESFRNMNNNFFDLIFQSSFPQYREKSIVMFLYLINTEDFSQKIFSISQLCLKYSQNKISIPWLDQTIHEMNYRLPKLFVIVFDILHTYIHNQFLIKFSQKENEEEKENPISIKEYFQQQDESNHLIEEIEKLQNYSVSNLQEFTKNILQLLKLLNQILFLENHDYFSNFEVIENVKPKFTNQN